MKPHYCLFVVLLALGLAASVTPSLKAQNSVDAASPESVPGGVIVRDGVAFWVFDGKAGRLDATTVPPGQMMLPNGRLLTLPPGVSGLPGGAAAAALDNAGSSAGTLGLTVVQGQVYIVVKGRATRVEPTEVPPGQMINWEGKKAAAPAGLTFVGSVTPGKVTPGKVTPGSVSVDGSVRGGDVKGGDVKGGDVKGGDVKGGDVKGGDVKGGDVNGGDVKGGDVKGGDVKGG